MLRTHVRSAATICGRWQRRPACFERRRLQAQLGTAVAVRVIAAFLAGLSDILILCECASMVCRSKLA